MTPAEELDARENYRHLVPQSQLSFLLSRRWIGFALFVVVLAGVCIRLGQWQMHRLDDRRDDNEVITRHLAEDPVPLSTVAQTGRRRRRRVGVDARARDRHLRRRARGHRHVHDPRRRTRRGRGDPAGDAGRIGDPGRPRLAGDGEQLRTAGRTCRLPRRARSPSTGWLRQNSGADDHAVEPVDGQVRAISSDGMATSVPYDLAQRLPEPAQPGAAGGDVARSSSPGRSSARARTSSTGCSGGSSARWPCSACSGSPGPS